MGYATGIAVGLATRTGRGSLGEIPMIMNITAYLLVGLICMMFFGGAVFFLKDIIDYFKCKDWGLFFAGLFLGLLFAVIGVFLICMMIYC